MTLLSHEPAIRLGVFLAMLAAMAAWELAAPARRAEVPRLIRWSNNLALVVVDTAVLRLVLPVLAVGAAVWAQAQGIGLLHLAPLPGWLAVVLAILALDLAIYGQHILMHKTPALWRLHRMHHADPLVDVTTGLRFHPLEILLSMLLKIALVVSLGAPPVAVLLFEVILNAASLFNHANIRLPPRVEALARLILITPDLHRIHHSEIRAETDSNYGFSVPWWDRLFRTFRARPALGPDGVVAGIGAFGTARDQWLDRLLIQPFRRPGA